MSSVTTSGCASPSVTSTPERSTSSVAMSSALLVESPIRLTMIESLSSSTTTGSMVMPVANFTSCITCSLVGSDMPTNRRLPRLPSAITRWFATILLSIRLSGSWSVSTAARSSSG